MLRQWGNFRKVTGRGYGVDFAYPIVFPLAVYAVIPFDVNGSFDDYAIPAVHAAWVQGAGSDDGNGKDLRWARIAFSANSSEFGNYMCVAIGR